jgi:hypothetical protein
MALAPPGYQRALQRAVPRAKRGAAPAPAVPALPDQLMEPIPPRLAGGPQLAALVDPQKRMPAQADNPPQQPVGLEAPIGQHQPRPVWRAGGAQTP